ncbi:MAG: GNAT family N-acetyltransferase [Reichenbachiella sp.]
MELEIREIYMSDTWPIRHEVMWPDQPFSFVKLEEDNIGKHYGLFVKGVLTSIVSVFIKDNELQFRKLATLNHEQGKGYGTKLLKFVLNEAGAFGVRRIWCNARVDKSAYYDRFGLTETGQKYVKGGIEFVVMEKNF